MPKEIHILIVEDEAKEADLLENVLKAIDARIWISSTRNGNYAINYLKNSHVDAVIASNAMSGVSGFEVLMDFRRRDTTTPFVLLSNSKDAGLFEAVEGLNAVIARHDASPAAWWTWVDKTFGPIQPVP